MYAKHDAPDEIASAREKASRSSAQDLSTLQLVADITAKVSLLIRKEAELATTEIKADLHRELAMVKAVGAAIVAALLSVNTLLVAVVLALAKVMPGWLAALVVGVSGPGRRGRARGHRMEPPGHTATRHDAEDADPGCAVGKGANCVAAKDHLPRASP